MYAYDCLVGTFACVELSPGTNPIVSPEGHIWTHVEIHSPHACYMATMEWKRIITDTTALLREIWPRGVWDQQAWNFVSSGRGIRSVSGA